MIVFSYSLNNSFSTGTYRAWSACISHNTFLVVKLNTSVCFSLPVTPLMLIAWLKLSWSLLKQISTTDNGVNISCPRNDLTQHICLSHYGGSHSAKFFIIFTFPFTELLACCRTTNYSSWNTRTTTTLDCKVIRIHIVPVLKITIFSCIMLLSFSVLVLSPDFLPHFLVLFSSNSNTNIRCDWPHKWGFEKSIFILPAIQ